MVIRSVYTMTKALDHTRPVIDTSGNFHVRTDIYDVHDYEQDVQAFAAHYEPMKNGGPVLAKALLENPRICALCYTQLYDVEQEKNGIYTYERKEKFPEEIVARMRAAMLTKAAIEA